MTDLAAAPRADGPGPGARGHRATATRRREDRVATEEPLEIRLAWPGAEPRRVWVTMRTPGHDFELAAGWLLHEGLARPGGIHEVAYCTDATLAPEQEFNVVTVTLGRAAGPRPRPPATARARPGSSACGVCGKDSIDDVLDHAAPSPGPADG